MLTIGVFVTRLAILLVTIDICLSIPITVTLGEDESGFHATPSSDERQKTPFGHIGSAVAPVVGAVVGPLLVNIANGITNGITSTISSGYEPLDYGHDPSPFGQYNVYLVNFDDEPQPYLLLDSIKNENRLEYYGAASSYKTTDPTGQSMTTENSSYEDAKDTPQIDSVD